LRDQLRSMSGQAAGDRAFIDRIGDLAVSTQNPDAPRE